MRQERSATQILFGYLPEQTVDLEGGVWKVSYWPYPLQHSVDTGAVREALILAARPWEIEGTDQGYLQMLRSGHDIAVVGVDPKNGVRVEPFPEQWRCKRCHRLANSPVAKCRCGVRSWGQLPFVEYCGGCGSLREPYLPTCPSHKDVTMEFPASASAREITLKCPTCNVVIRKGFGFAKCRTCGDTPQHNVHRAASVYAARTIVMVNAPSPDRIQRLRESGGEGRALRWMLNGMSTKGPAEEAGGVEDVRRALAAQNLPEAVIAAAIAAMEVQAPKSEADALPLSPDGRQQAMSVALALDEERATLTDFAGDLEVGSALHSLHTETYPASLKRAGIEQLDLTTRFPLLTGAFGYTRGDTTPGGSALVPYRDRENRLIVYGDLQATEAWFVRLDAVKVLRWLRLRGHDLPNLNEPSACRRVILESSHQPSLWSDPPSVPTVGSDVLTLVHSYSHRLIRAATSLVGIDRDALSEYLVPMHLGFFVYAAGRGDFVLGGLEAVFEQDLHHVLDRVAIGDYRCALDPGCARHGGACVACLHLGEPSCRIFNRYLDRGAVRTFLKAW